MDEVLRSDIHFQEHTGVITHKLTQPSEDLILERAKELRRNKGALHDLGAQGKGGSWGRMLASIPRIMYEQAKRDGFELDHPDRVIRDRALNRFLRTPMGKACLV